MKYIIIDNGETDSGITFPDHVQHKAMAESVKLLGKVTSAGFIKIKDGNIICHGESDSLKLRSFPSDSWHFENLLK